jgi:uncharacterized OsmC-like protein
MSFMETFLRLAEKEKIVIRGYECNCNGIMDRTLPRLSFKRIVVHPKVTVGSDDDIPLVEHCMEEAEKYSVIRNSVKPKVVLEYRIEVKKGKGASQKE